MEKLIFGALLASGMFLVPHDSFSQQQAAYQVPESYSFDYEVVQQVKGEQKNSGGPKTLSYYYTQNGGYMGIRPNSDKSVFMIYTKDGVSIIIDDQKKTITVLRLGNLMGDLGKAVAEQKKNNPSQTSPRADSSGKLQSSVKTGSTKQICGYPAQEYTYKNSKGESGSVWYAKVDFNASSYYISGMMGSSFSGGAATGKNPQMQNYPSLNDPHLMVAEAKSDSHPDEGITTQSISKKTMSIQTKGYTINNMSNMGLKEMMEMKSKQN